MYVKNLPYAAAETDIVGLFAACGHVTDVRRGSTEGESKLGVDGLRRVRVTGLIPVSNFDSQAAKFFQRKLSL